MDGEGKEISFLLRFLHVFAY